ncbi:hypothetical protein J3R82DRAFT_3220 [Butyriboletus roseoflavus]|nr:hypothetical protein J3R82DRAFT_3220 [Butyriboletus roseoflavus]
MFRFVQWEDTISFHARLFRCFLLGFLDAHRELAVLSHGSKWMLAVLGQRLADTGLMHDAGHLHEPISDRASPPGHHNGAPIQCPPERKYEATSLLSSAVNSPMDQTMPLPPFVFPQPINITHGLYDEPTLPAVAFDLLGSIVVPDGFWESMPVPPTGVVGFILLWVLTLAIVVSHCSSTGSGSFRALCRSPRVAVESTTNSHERPQGGLPIDGATQRVVSRAPEDVGHQASMPGAWLHERQEQNMLETLEESVFNTMSWTLFCSCAPMGIKAWVSFPGLTAIFTSDAWNRGSNNVVTIRRISEHGPLTVCRGLGLNKLDLDAGVSTPVALDKSEHGTLQPIESCLAIRNLRGSITRMHNRRCGPVAINNVAPMDRDPTRTTTLEVVCGDKVGLTFGLVGSSNVDHFLCQEDTTSDVDDSGGDDRYDGTEDEGLFGVGTHRADTSQLEGKDGYRVLGRRQDGTLSDTGCPPSLRRVRSTGHLGKKHDIFDDDDGRPSDDPYWTEQVNARLSGERDPRRISCRYGWSDVASRPREGREDETDNWRTRSSQVTQFSAPKIKSDAGQCQGNSDGIKLRRYSSPPLNVDASHTHRAGSGDGPQGTYVVPQKRGRPMGGRYWSPVSSPQSSVRPSGLDFFPLRKTPSLLTLKAWRPGCLYVPEPPVDEARQADGWWDSLSSVCSCGSASGVGHRCGFGAMNQDGPDRGAPFSQDAQGAPVSWRNRHKNNPASRRFASVHRRAMTEG